MSRLNRAIIKCTTTQGNDGSTTTKQTHPDGWNHQSMNQMPGYLHRTTELSIVDADRYDRCQSTLIVAFHYYNTSS